MGSEVVSAATGTFATSFMRFPAFPVSVHTWHWACPEAKVTTKSSVACPLRYDAEFMKCRVTALHTVAVAGHIYVRAGGS
jgi:hypothetical protein